MDSIKDTVNSVSSGFQSSGTSQGQQGSTGEIVSKGTYRAWATSLPIAILICGDEGVEYLQEKATGSKPQSSDNKAASSSGPSASDVRQADPEKIQDFIRDKYKSDPNDFPDVKKGNDP